MTANNGESEADWRSPWTTTADVDEFELPKASTNEKKRPSIQGVCSYVFEKNYTIITPFQSFLAIQNGLTDIKQPAFGVQYFSASPEIHFDHLKLSEGAHKILYSPNAGGSSERSEALSFEILRKVFGAQLVKTEMGIEYEWSISKRTDYSAKIYKTRYGVSVTRAMKYKGEFGVDDATALLTKKLNGVNLSSRDVVEPDAWSKQILHIFTETINNSQVLALAYDKLSDDLKANTVVIVTVTPDSDWLYFNYL